MKTKLFIAMALIAIIVLAFIGCPAEQKSEPEHVHQWGAWVVTTAPTCTTEGVETKTCVLDATHKETRPIAKDPDAHQWGAWTQTKAPTINEEGEETRTCDLDATHKQTRPIAKLESFTVTFHANGGTPEPAQQTIEKGNSASEPPAPTKANYTLEGWYKESALTTKWNFSTDTVTADVGLYAKWVLADKAFREYNDKAMFVVYVDDEDPTNTETYYADIVDGRIGAREKSLEQILDDNNKNIVERLQNAVTAAYNAGGGAVKGRFLNVFENVTGSDKVVITIENNTSYDSYKVGTTFNDLRISIEYLSTVSATDLQAAITAAVRSMNDKIAE
jgi:uncharacterized repeat protein (TIGR02543 family)